MFSSTLCYDNANSYDFLSCKMFPHLKCSWVKFFKIILQDKIRILNEWKLINYY
jgi:hypothetical protein